MKKLTRVLLTLATCLGATAIIFLVPFEKIPNAIFGAISLGWSGGAVIATALFFIKDNKEKVKKVLYIGFSILYATGFMIWAIKEPITSNIIPMVMLIIMGVIICTTVLFNIAYGKEKNR